MPLKYFATFAAHIATMLKTKACCLSLTKFTDVRRSFREQTRFRRPEEDYANNIKQKGLIDYHKEDFFCKINNINTSTLIRNKSITPNHTKKCLSLFEYNIRMIKL